MRSQIHLEVRHKVVEKLGYHSLRHHCLVNSKGYIKCDNQVVGNLHIHLLLLNFQLMTVCTSLGVTTHDLGYTG